MRCCSILAVLAWWATALEAQTLRPFTTFRQMHGEHRLLTQVEFSGGMLRVVPGRSDELYRMELAFDQAQFTPTSTYNAADNTLVIGSPSLEGVEEEADTKSDSNNIKIKIEINRNKGDHPNSAATLAFSPLVDAAVKLGLSAAETDMELGGLRVSTLEVTTITGQTTIRFSRPNGIGCRVASVNSGAAELSLFGLGNSRCQEIKLEGWASKLLLDFSGTWTSNTTVHATIAVGALKLRLPRQVGVRVTMKKVLAGFEPNGLVSEGDSFVSANYESAPQHLDLDLAAKLGVVMIEWIGD